MTYELKSLVSEFKQITERSIESVQSEDYNELNLCINERQSIIDKMNKLNVSKEDLKAEFVCNNIDDLQAKLGMLIYEKKNKIKEETAKILNAANVSKNYYSTIQKKSIIFSKKV